MEYKNIIISVPTDDLERAYQFYLHGMGFKLAHEMPDGSRPEPVVFQLNPNTQFMLVPRDGFAFVTPGNSIAAPGISEYIMSIAVDSNDEVDKILATAKTAGVAIVAEANQQPWGYVGVFKDLDGHLWQIICAQQM